MVDNDKIREYMEQEAKRRAKQRAPIAVVSEVLGYNGCPTNYYIWMTVAYMKGEEIHEQHVAVRFGRYGMYWNRRRQIWINIPEAIEAGIYKPELYEAEGKRRRKENNRIHNQRRRARKRAENAA